MNNINWNEAALKAFYDLLIRVLKLNSSIFVGYK